jgi:mono/diheme cytochrome c family protein
MPDRLPHAAVTTGSRPALVRTPFALRPPLSRIGLAAVLIGFLAAGAHAPVVQAQTPQPPVQGNGRLLYETHCIACHDKQVHWRDGRLAVDWSTLDAQVRRWQATALLNWGEAEITAVTRYLNETIYKFRQTGDRLSLSMPLEPASGRSLPTM